MVVISIFYKALNRRVTFKIKHKYAQSSYNNHATLNSQENRIQNNN